MRFWLVPPVLPCNVLSAQAHEGRISWTIVLRQGSDANAAFHLAPSVWVVPYQAIPVREGIVRRCCS